MPSAHAALRRELLVRYLDAWLPAVLHGRKRVTYVDGSRDGAAARAAAAVFAEFPDLLAGRQLSMVLAGAGTGIELTAPAGITVRRATGDLREALAEDGALGSPIFAWFEPSTPERSWLTVAANPDSELMLTLSGDSGDGDSGDGGSGDADPGDAGLAAGPAATPALLDRLSRVGIPLHAQVEFVDGAGRSEVLIFGTCSEKALGTFKDALWALDEYAGIRYRDPADRERTLLDISLQPNLRPLRRALTAHVSGTGEQSLADLRVWALHETIYRAADATRAVQALVAAGEVTREPAAGRLSPATLIHAA